MIFGTLPVTKQPVVVLANYSIFEITSESWQGKTYHFVGEDVKNHCARTSTPILMFDKTQMIGITASGRTYKLVNSANEHSIEASDESYIFNLFFKVNGGKTKKDVTQDFMAGTQEITKNLLDPTQSHETPKLKRSRAQAKKPS